MFQICRSVVQLYQFLSRLCRWTHQLCSSEQLELFWSAWILTALCWPADVQMYYFSGLFWNVLAKEVSFVFLLHFRIRVLDFFRQVLFPQQVIRLICALYGICTQQYLPDGVFKKQCYSISAAGIVGFHADVLVKLGISVETSRLKVSYWEACQIQHWGTVELLRDKSIVKLMTLFQNISSWRGIPVMSRTQWKAST